jgi:uncharacterized damage-inducible protein DinB
MTDVPRYLIEPAAGIPAREAASFVSQMDDQNTRLIDAIRDISIEDLDRQLGAGMNSIGMLLAHLAIVEVVWARIGLFGSDDVDPTSVIGLGQDDDGMPLPPDGRVPANLTGKAFPYYEDLLARARVYFKDAASRLSDADLDREITRTRPDGSKRTFSTRWALYHSLEHIAGHRGQILLLRHLYRAGA